MSDTMLIKRITIPIAIIAIGIVYFWINPTENQWVPKCFFKQLTGFQCPSCGMQRAIHSFVHGDILVGLKYNFFLLFAIPYATAVIVASFYNVNNNLAALRRVVFSAKTLQVYVILYFVWWILRNILDV